MKDHLEISLAWQGKQVDLAVPSTVTAIRLIELLSQAFEKNKQSLPPHWHFTVKGKTLVFASHLTLAELGLGNGDILQLIVGEE